jgi:acyl-CoA reductase-like NAD-dependent aldehyde dehydrogenase
MSKLISTNPSRNYEVIGEVEASTEQDVQTAIAKARQAQPAWADLSVADRCQALASFVDVSKSRAEEIAQLIATETSRPIQSARGNVAGGTKYFEGYFEIAEKHLAPQVTSETGTEITRVYHEPYGVVAAICPWNYPFQNVAWQCGQALIAGNTIVYKNSEENPLFAKLLAELFAQSDVPEGVFNVIYGDGAVGEMLVRGNIDMISFTGSTETGQALTKIAAEKFIPISTELGGSSPCIVFEDAATDKNLEYIVNMRFKNAGQACDAIKRLIVHEAKFDQVVERLCKIIATKKVGDTLDEDTEIGPLVAKRQLEKLESQVQDARGKGAKVLIGGQRPQGLQGAYYEPTVLTNVANNMRVWHEETFGPVLPVVSFKTEEEAVELANDTKYGLGAHIMTTDRRQFERVARQIKSGMVAHNRVAFWGPNNPFGGFKQSGMGRTHGEYGFREVTQPKIVAEEK